MNSGVIDQFCMNFVGTKVDRIVENIIKIGFIYVVIIERGIGGDGSFAPHAGDVVYFFEAIDIFIGRVCTNASRAKRGV